MSNAVAVMAVSERGTMYDASACFYMEKLVMRSRGRRHGRPRCAGRRTTSPPSPGPRASPSQDVTVAILERPRHDDLVAEVRASGARVKLLSDGDVAGAVMAASEGTGVDLLLGIGGTPEGIITACAVTCLGGVILGRLWPPATTRSARRSLDAGHDITRVLTTDDLVASDNVFFVATGITDGELVARRALRPRRRHHGIAGHALEAAGPSAGCRASTS